MSIQRYADHTVRRLTDLRALVDQHQRTETEIVARIRDTDRTVTVTTKEA
jgi:hypothetical protein